MMTEHTDRQQLADIAVQYTRVDWEAAWAVQPEAVEWLIEPVIEAGTVNSLFAKPGTGKSLIALEWALNLVRAGRPVLYIDHENRITDIVERLQAFGAEPGELGRLAFYSFASLPPLDTLAGGFHLLALAAHASAVLVIIDTTSRLIRGGENDSDTFLNLYRHSMRPLKARGIAVLRLDHPGKDAERGQRGSSAKDGDVDTIWRFAEVTKGRAYRLHREKSRSGHGQSDMLDVAREYAPVRHVISVPDRSPETSPLGQLCGQLSKLGVPPSAGRDRCRTALVGAGIAVRNELLAEVIKHRKRGCDCPGQAGTGQLPQSQGCQLSPFPPHYREGERGQVSSDLPRTGPRPPCDHTECHDALLGECLGDEGRAAQRKFAGWPEGSIGEEAS